MSTSTVLAIDGGGMRGMIPAAVLDRLEQVTGKRVCELFDYVAGTSTGGILALGLGLERPGGAMPYSAGDLMQMYMKEGHKIFSRGFLHVIGALGSLNGPKYPADGATYALIDGGMFANNPALCAWVEAHEANPDAEIVVVSLGTGNENKRVKFDDAKDWGLAGWAPHLNTGPRRNHYRFQSDISGAQQEMDDTDPGNLESLRAVGVRLAATDDFREVCARLLSVRGNGQGPGEPRPGVA